MRWAGPRPPLACEKVHNRPRDEILRLTLPVFVDYPFEQMSIKAVADLCGISHWSLRHHFQNVERLFRTIAVKLLDDVEAQASFTIERKGPLLEIISDYAELTANLCESQSFRQLLHFVVRNGRHHPWVAKRYDKRIVGRICSGLEEAVHAAGETKGMPIALRGDAARRFFKRLETELAVSTLIPSPAQPVNRSDLIRTVSRELFSATYVFDWRVPDSLGAGNYKGQPQEVRPLD